MDEEERKVKSKSNTFFKGKKIGSRDSKGKWLLALHLKIGSRSQHNFTIRVLSSS